MFLCDASGHAPGPYASMPPLTMPQEQRLPTFHRRGTYNVRQPGAHLHEKYMHEKCIYLAYTMHEKCNK